MHLPKHEANKITMMYELPHLLAEKAESVIEEIQESLLHRKGLGYTGRDHESGDDQIGIDRHANNILRKFVYDQRFEFSVKWGCRLIYLSEEQRGMAFTGDDADPDIFEDGDLIIICDPLDGSTNAKSYGEGFSTVAVAFLRSKSSYEHIGGAIVGSNGYSVAWSGTGWVQIRRAHSKNPTWETIDTAWGKRNVSASVATKKDRYSQFMKNLDKKNTLAHAMAGTPCIFALLTLELGLVIEANPQKVWDGAHLIPSLMAGCRAVTIPDGRSISLDQVLGYFIEYLDNFHNLREQPLIPPFRITTQQRIDSKTTDQQQIETNISKVPDLR